MEPPLSLPSSRFASPKRYLILSLNLFHHAKEYVNRQEIEIDTGG